MGFFFASIRRRDGSLRRAIIIYPSADVRSGGEEGEPLEDDIDTKYATNHLDESGLTHANDMDAEPMATVMEEIDATLSLHCRPIDMTQESSQEPIVTLRGFAGSGRDPEVLCRLAEPECWWHHHLGGNLPRDTAQALSGQAVTSLERWLCQTARKDGREPGAQHSSDAADFQGVVQGGRDAPHYTEHCLQGHGDDGVRVTRTSTDEVHVSERGAHALEACSGGRDQADGGAALSAELWPALVGE
eukprot:5292078-Pleurochrysis_carterae.AAC.3